MGKEVNGLVMVSFPKNPYLIYQIRSENKNDISIYIGVTKNYESRSYQHAKNRKYSKYNGLSLYKWMNTVIEDEKEKVNIKIIERGYTEKEAYKREQELICMYRWNGFNVLNIADGGKGPFGRNPWNKGVKNPFTEEQLKKLSTSHIGQGLGRKNPHTEKTKQLISLRNKERKERGWINPRGKKVYKYDKDNNLLKIYTNLQEAGINENTSPSSVGEWCRKEKQPRNNFIWSYEKLF